MQSPVKQLALQHGIPVLQPESLKSEQAAKNLSDFAPDVLVVVAYGLILPQAIIDVPKFGCINVHASILPRWRGAAPIERAILAGDKESGVTIIQMDAGLDTGAMLHSVPVDINDEDNRETLSAKLEEVGPEALLFALDNLATLKTSARVQDDALATYAHKLEKSEAEIDWDSSAAEVSRKIRAGIGRLPAYTCLDGHRLRILDAQVSTTGVDAAPGTITATSKDSFTVACRDSSLIVNVVQLPGKTAMRVRDVLNSRPALFSPGNRFTSGAKTP